jgi:hypothetical protein
MALTHNSVRTCFLWKEVPLFTPGTCRQRLWTSLLSCLEVFQSPRFADRTGNTAEVVDTSVKDFLQDLLELAAHRDLAARLRAGLAESPAVGLLREWRALDPEEDGGEGMDVPGDATRLLFQSALTRALAAYSLGQLAFLFGHLWLAKEYTVEAYNFLQEELARTTRTDDSGAAQNLELLTVTLLIEVLFHSQGYDTLRDEKNQPYARGIARELAKDGQGYLQGLPSLQKVGLQVRNGKISDHAKDYIKNFWMPIPTGQDTEDLDFQYLDPRKPNPLAAAYVLSRRNRAGMLHYRYRDWRSAKKEFLFVDNEIKALRAVVQDPVLVPVEMEAKLYLGRISAQLYKFDDAETLLGEAEEYFQDVQDEFAKNKMAKAKAELLYRRSRLVQAKAKFQEVSAVSRRNGFVHDWASAEMHLAKIESGFGFQATAAKRFARVNAHFSQYDVPRETIECLFWSTAAQARHLDLQGHPRESVINARALLKVYRRLFEGSGKLGSSLLRSDISWLLEALEDKRDPDVTEVMLDLRLGEEPKREMIEKLRCRLDGSALAVAGGEELTDGPDSKRARNRAKEDRLVGQILRLVALQQGARPPRARGAAEESWFPKMTIRDRVLGALESVTEGDEGSACEALLWVQREIDDRALGGGLVPFLVDLSQFFLQRDSFIALLLLLLDKVDRAISSESVPSPDAGPLKEVYRSLTKYLVLERNFYLGPPAFEVSRGGGLPLWRKLQRKYAYPQREWKVLYKSALKGGHGLDYPGNAVGLGWVESLDTGGATLRIAWVEEVRGGELRTEHFERLQVPMPVVSQGNAEESMASVVLVGRQGAGAGDVPWTAHRIPLDLGDLQLFRALRSSPWYEPVLETWRSLLARFNGSIPATCGSPQLTATDWETIETRYAEFARSWFGDRFSDSEFRRLFKVKRRSSRAFQGPPNLPQSREDDEARSVLGDYLLKLAQVPAQVGT